MKDEDFGSVGVTKPITNLCTQDVGLIFFSLKCKLLLCDYKCNTKVQEGINTQTRFKQEREKN